MKDSLLKRNKELLDHFAAVALLGLINSNSLDGYDHDDVAEEAYNYAYSMLGERKKLNAQTFKRIYVTEKKE